MRANIMAILIDELPTNGNSKINSGSNNSNNE